MAEVANSLGIADAGEARPADIGIVREEFDEVFCFGNLKGIQLRDLLGFVELADLVQEACPAAPAFQQSGGHTWGNFTLCSASRELFEGST